jgi:hypothetical protein
VMTFPPEHLADPATYRAAAQLAERATEAERQVDADRRRDLAVQGFLDLRGAMERGDAAALESLYAAAARLVQPLVSEWQPIWEGSVGAQAERTRATLSALEAGDWSGLLGSGVFEADATPGERRFGMCGRLSTYRLGA